MRVFERLEELAALGDRIGYSPEEDAAHELAAGWMREAGLEVEVDAAGNLIGRVPGAAALLVAEDDDREAGQAQPLDGLEPGDHTERA
ncbi:MAG TPA: hypothetical protein VNT23_00175, partial [Gaiellaceae bacterium]|nr:hypothetical protein [Gaiellaceae bacterium]